MATAARLYFGGREGIFLGAPSAFMIEARTWTSLVMVFPYSSLMLGLMGELVNVNFE